MRYRSPAILLLLFLTVAVAAGSCSSAPSGSPSPKIRSTLAVCPFKVGDTYSKYGGGAAIPEPGLGVIGFGDGTDGGTTFQAETSKDGMVVITARSTRGGTPRPDFFLRCQLP